jgi:hypothetical protein
MTKQTNEAIQAFMLSQSQLGAAIKNAKNPFLKNNYADLNAIQQAVLPVFHANGFAIMQLPMKDDLGDYVETIFAHVSGEKFTCKVYLHYKKDDMQSYGGAITYARRYGLSSMSGVPVEDDDGNLATGKKNQNVKSPTQHETAVERGIKLMKFIETANADKFNGMFDKASKLISEIRVTDADFSQKIATAWENKQIELGIN